MQVVGRLFPRLFSPSMAKQSKLDFDGRQQELIELLAAYVVVEMLPISIIDSLSFRHILGKIQLTGSGVPEMESTRTKFEF